MFSTKRCSGRISGRGLLLGAAVAVFLLAVLFSERPTRDASSHAAAARTERSSTSAPAVTTRPAEGIREAAATAEASAPPRPRSGRSESAFPSVPAMLPAGTARDLEPKTLLRLPWGRVAGAIGIFMPQDEGLPVGPASFAVGPDGRVYVADRVNRKIAVFLPDGRFDRTFNAEDNLADLVVDGAGRIHTLDAGTGDVRTLDPRTGAATAVVSLGTMNVGDEPVEGLVVRDGQVFVRRADQTLHAVAGDAGGWTPDRLVTAWPEGGVPAADIPARDAAPARRFPVEIETSFVQGSAQYLGPDGSGGSYLLVETLGPDGRIDSGVRRYDGEGRLLGAVPVPYKNLAQPERTFTTDARGGLYQMVTGEEGVRILRWFAED